MLILALCCLVINEIAHAPTDPKAEYVELLHVGSSRITLSGATLYDARSTPRLISDRPIELEPGAYLVLVRDGGAFSQSFPGVPYLKVAGWPSLNNAGDRIAIAVDGVELDAVAYDSNWGRGPASLERLDPTGPSNHRVNWRPSSVIGTPGRQNSQYAPDTTPPSLIYAEVFAPDSALVVFSEPVLYAPAAAFGGGSVEWKTDSSAVIVGTPFLADWPTQASLAATQIEDLFGNTAAATAVLVARSPSPGQLVISERLVRPEADPFDGLPDQVRFLEIWNRSDALLSARGLKLQSQETERGARLSSTVPFVPRAMAPGAAILLVENPVTARLGFSDIANTDVREVGSGVLGQPRLSLSGRLGKQLDRTAYDPTWFAPLQGERGNSLSRIGDEGLAPLAWTSDPLGPSPGIHRAWAPLSEARHGDVVFSEVLFHARTGQAEFIELMVRVSTGLDGLHIVIDRTPAPPDSLRIIFGPAVFAPETILTAVFPVSGVPTADLASHFRTAHPNATGTLLPLSGSHALRNDGVTLELRSGRGLLLDRVHLTPNQHAPDLATVAGVSLERVDPAGSSLEMTNWVSARAAEGGTPGQPFSGTLSTNSPAHRASEDVFRVFPRVFDPSEGPVAVEFATQIQSTLQVRVFSRWGQELRSLPLQTAGGGGRVYWDGRDASGRLVETGIYLILVRDSSGRTHKNPVVIAER